MSRTRAIVLASLAGAVAYALGVHHRPSVPPSGEVVPELDPALTYEECPECHGEGEFCTRCWDQGLVVHNCSEG